jgi:hypothetical protein
MSPLACDWLTPPRLASAAAGEIQLYPALTSRHARRVYGECVGGTRRHAGIVTGDGGDGPAALGVGGGPLGLGRELRAAPRRVTQPCGTLERDGRPSRRRAQVALQLNIVHGQDCLSAGINIAAKYALGMRLGRGFPGNLLTHITRVVLNEKFGRYSRSTLRVIHGQVPNFYKITIFGVSAR